jgi:hypothetical protein
MTLAASAPGTGKAEDPLGRARRYDNPISAEKQRREHLETRHGSSLNEIIEHGEQFFRVGAPEHLHRKRGAQPIEEMFLRQSF